MTATMPTEAILRAWKHVLWLHRADVDVDVLEALIGATDLVLEREGRMLLDTPEHEGEDLLGLPGGIVVGARSTYAYATCFDPGLPLWTTPEYARSLERVVILSERAGRARERFWDLRSTWRATKKNGWRSPRAIVATARSLRKAWDGYR